MNNIKKVMIDDVEYELNVDRAKQAGFLKREYPLIAGDIYKHPLHKMNPFLLVKVTYDDQLYQLLGMGPSVNSGKFFNTAHNLAEINSYLKENNMFFDRNIAGKLQELVYE